MNKIITLIGLFCFSLLIVNAQEPIQHDAEHYILLSQHQDRCEAEDKDIDSKLENIQKENDGKKEPGKLGASGPASRRGFALASERSRRADRRKVGR